jgi:DNA-binding MarR family transcriptional regulator
MNEEQRQRLIQQVLDFNDAMMLMSLRQTVGELLHSDLTMAQMKTLAYLSMVMPEGAKMSELAKALGVGLSSTTGIMDRLVEQGLAERREDATDRRHVLIQLSAKGWEQAEALNRGYREPLIAMLKAMPDKDLEQMATALLSLREVMGRWVSREDHQDSPATEQSQP